MCYSAKISLITFVLSILTSSCLLLYGQTSPYQNSLNVIGYLFIYVAFVQLFEYFMWIDLSGKLGINQIFTFLIRYLVYLQPFVLYLVGNYYSPFPSWLKTLNIIYFVMLLVYLTLTNRLGVTSKTTSKSHLKWNNMNSGLISGLYLLLITLNIFYSLEINYAIVTFSVLALSLTYSYLYIYESIGELWCFFGALIPVVLLIYSWIREKKYIYSTR